MKKVSAAAKSEAAAPCAAYELFALSECPKYFLRLISNIHCRSYKITSLIKGRLPGRCSRQAPSVGKRKGL
jgi:hypothetical protein